MSLLFPQVCANRQLGSERFLAPEILFNPELIGQEDPGVHQVRHSRG
jgi:hypothetical protein